MRAGGGRGAQGPPPTYAPALLPRRHTPQRRTRAAPHATASPPHLAPGETRHRHLRSQPPEGRDARRGRGPHGHSAPAPPAHTGRACARTSPGPLLSPSRHTSPLHATTHTTHTPLRPSRDQRAGGGGGRAGPATHRPHPTPRATPRPAHRKTHQRPGGRASERERERAGQALSSTRPSALGSVNDPSAGSPTETLLRLLLPLDSQVRPSSQRSARAVGRPRRGRSEGLTKPSNR